jgi:glycosyltransferase involved in cell wall biosynthesis
VSRSPDFRTRVRSGLVSRLSALAREWGVGAPPRDGAAADAARIAQRLATETLDRENWSWIVLTVCGGSYPTPDSVVELERLRVTRDSRLAVRLLELAIGEGEKQGSLERRIDFVRGAVLVDVDFAARHEHNTGIQRVIRSTVSRWASDNRCLLVAWEAGGYRVLGPVERARIVDFSSTRPPADAHDPALLVPLAGTLILMEVPGAKNLDRLTSIARFSGVRTAVIGYDAIPLVSRETVSRSEMVRFGKYLTFLKYSTLVAAISHSAAEEFAGFVQTLPAQGLSGPQVTTCALPNVVSVADGSGADRSADSPPLVLCVGSKEPRKNHVAVLVAAERLWRAGLEFELRFVGAYGWDTRDFRRWLRRLQRSGRAVYAPAVTTDAELADLYAAARFSVFVSLHEGFGLPIVESLSRGIPVLTSSIGSMAELAVDGGCLTAGPRDDQAIFAAMRRLLTDDVLIAELAEQARRRTPRTWDDYAEELWLKAGDAK